MTTFNAPEGEKNLLEAFWKRRKYLLKALIFHFYPLQVFVTYERQV